MMHSLPVEPLATKSGSTLRKLFVATALAGGFLAGAPAWAQTNYMPVEGLYIGGGVGVNFLEGYSLKQSGPINNAITTLGFPRRNGKVNFDAGFTGLASLGWGFGNGLRVEVEGSYRGNDVDKIKGIAGPILTSTGALSSVNTHRGYQQTPAVMVNALYDFDIPDAPWIAPYIGAGIGAGWQELGNNNVTFLTNTLQDSPRFHYSGSKTAFAYQAIVGAGFPIEQVPGLAITTEFRFFGTEEQKFSASVQSVRTGRTLATGDIKTTNYNYAILLGVRYNFGRTPPPPPPPAAVPPAAAPARTYLVFFDWDRADLTDRARQVIAQAAQTSRSTQTTRIEVNGYTDTSGKPAYNQRLSVRRAQSVAAELVRDGVPRNEISIQGFGQTHLLVPTADGVREPQNRRVEIILH
jgi:OOP family OmpA-OmpF porin